MANKGKGKMKNNGKGKVKNNGKSKMVSDKGKAPARSADLMAWGTSDSSEGLGLQMEVSPGKPALIDSATTTLQTGTIAGEGRDPAQSARLRRLRLSIMDSSDEELEHQLQMEVPTIQIAMIESARTRQAGTMAGAGDAPAQSVPHSETPMGIFQEKTDEIQELRQLGLVARYYSDGEAGHTRARNNLKKVGEEDVLARGSPSIETAASAACALLDFDVKIHPSSERTPGDGGVPAKNQNIHDRSKPGELASAETGNHSSESTGGIRNALRRTPRRTPVRRGELASATHVELAEILGSLTIGSNIAPNAGDGQQQRPIERSTQRAHGSRSRERSDSTRRSRWRRHAGGWSVRSLSPDGVLTRRSYSRTPSRSRSRSRSRDRQTRMANGNSCRGTVGVS